MADIKRVLVTLPWPEALLAELRAALAPAELFECGRRDRRGIAAALRHVDVALIAGDLDARFVAAPRLRWVHCNHAGLERSAAPAAFDRGLLITSAAGRSAPALAEHAMLFVLALNSRFDRFLAAQRAHRWGVRGQKQLRALAGKTLGIVGLGHSGKELARRARAFGLRVIAYRRRDADRDCVDALYCEEAGDTLTSLLTDCDFVVLTLPLSDATRHLIDGAALDAMRADACLINMARGGLVDEAALLRALQAGRIAGAATDVAEEEPLPAHSPLWDAPNLLLTPHFTPPLQDRDERALRLLLDNLARYRADRPLRNQLTPADRYTPASPGAGDRGRSTRQLAQRWQRVLRRLRRR